MFSQVLVPLDSSPRAERAIPIAARIAQISGGTLRLVQVVKDEADASVEGSEKENEAQLAAARAYLQRLLQMEQLQQTHTQAEAIAGQPAEQILALAKERGSDLIVLCSHGYTGVSRWLMGSVAEQVARRAHLPVLILRRDGLVSAGILSGAASILVPLNGSAESEKAILPAAQLVSALSSPARGVLHLTRVVVLPRADLGNNQEREEIVQEAELYMSSTVERLQANLSAKYSEGLNLSITWSVTVDDDIASGIARVAEDGERSEEAILCNASQMIAMTTHGLGGEQAWATGSIAERVLQTTRLPLLIVS